MRLLNTSTLKLHDFHNKRIPPYAILSHTWGDEEVMFQDWGEPSFKLRSGYAKITSCCALTLSDGWEYVWVDTCCIDKTSSAELSEAINSMYRWYQNAEVCYAYMVDMKVYSENEEFRESRWFERGWTLQELLASRIMFFYDQEWREIGTKLSLRTEISRASRIREEHIENPMEASVAAKMSWAARRETTRLEDIAYCLMGLFEVNMPLLYGEGSKAFRRLQEMILQKTSDESLFTWGIGSASAHPLASIWVHRPVSLFAHSPDDFTWSGDIIPMANPLLYRRPSVITNSGLEIDVHTDLLIRNRDPSWGGTHTDMMINSGNHISVLLLNCVYKDWEDYPLFIPLSRRTENSYVRDFSGKLPRCSIEAVKQTGPFDSRRVYIEAEYDPLYGQFFGKFCIPADALIKLAPPGHGFSLAEETISRFTNRASRDRSRPILRVDLGGWQLPDRYSEDSLMFSNTHGETFILKFVKMSNQHKGFKVYIPGGPVNLEDLRRQRINLCGMDDFFASTNPTDRKSGISLQADSEISISMRKKLLVGVVFYVVEINVLRKE